MTIDDDVAAALERLRRSGHDNLKELINQALRRGLKELEGPARARKPFRTRPVSGGRCLVGSLDDVSEAIAIAEGKGHH